MLRRLVLTATASVAALSAAPVAAHADTAADTGARAGDRLTVTVMDAGEGQDGTFDLECRPTGGSHPDADGACATLDQVPWGKDPFAPVAPDAMCTMQYGGPATAHITGTWHGRHVDASFKRTDGCEISRWDSLVPVLPTTAGA
ncbi:SSI family serine proteinase inhibitor [Actinomycetota bacterium Odt1-20B]